MVKWLMLHFADFNSLDAINIEKYEKIERYHVPTLRLFALLNKNKKRKLSNFFLKKNQKLKSI